MDTVTHIQVRDARDRLIDLLEIGQTYPLRDLTVRDEQLTVTFNTTAKIPIEESQTGVLYQLHENNQPAERTSTGAKGTGVAIEAEGNGATLFLETYKIQDDVTFEIYACKMRSGKSAYLQQTATVKVGLDVTLAAQILDAPFLDPATPNPVTAPRIVDFGTSAAVAVENSQEGVDYGLVYLQEMGSGQPPEEVALSAVDVRGDLHRIVLHTSPMQEDTDIRIRATKTFDPSEHRATQSELLKVVLPLKVRANPALQVAVDTAPIVGFQQAATIKIAGTQQSARYKIFLHNIADSDFVRTAAPGAEVVSVAVDGEPDVQVRALARGPVWTPPEGYTELGDFQVGNGGELRFATGVLTDDTLVVVQAEKTHQASQDPQINLPMLSAIQLAQAAVVLVRPDPAPRLILTAWLNQNETDGLLQVEGGQPGIFYFLRRDPAGPDLGLPAYFHKRDAQDARVNKGVGQLVTEVDFVVTRAAPSIPVGANPAEIAPAPPLLETGPIPIGAALHIRAVKAQTRVATALAVVPQLPEGPAAGPDEPVVDYGAKARIRIKASRAKEWYRLLKEGKPLTDPVKGTGQDRLLDTDELQEDTLVQLVISQPDEVIGLERIIPMVVKVRPDKKRAVTPITAQVAPNKALQVQVAGSQPGVRYQLQAGDVVLGQAIDGNGDTIVLDSGPMSEDTTLFVRAAKVTDPVIFVMLEQQITVQVQAENAPG